MSAAADRPTALVTGANRGVGLETSNQLRAKGFRVILTSRDEKKGTASVRGLDPAGRDVAYHQLDITDAASISAVAHDLPGLASRLDLLVNNAGIGSWGADRRASVRTIATNYFGSRDVTDALLPFIPDGGRVVMVSSGLGELSYRGCDRGILPGREENRLVSDTAMRPVALAANEGESRFSRRSSQSSSDARSRFSRREWEICRRRDWRPRWRTRERLAWSASRALLFPTW